MTLRTLLNAASLVLLSVLCLGQAAVAATPYRIDITVIEDGALIGKPAVLAESGAQAELRVEDPQKPNDGFRILVTATSQEDTANGKESVQLHVVFYGRLKGQWVERGDHSVMAVVGRNVSFSFPPGEHESAGKKYDLILTTSQVKAPAPAK